MRSKSNNEYNNNLTVYIAKGDKSMKSCLVGKQVTHHNYTLLLNGSCSIRQMIDVAARGAADA